MFDQKEIIDLSILSHFPTKTFRKYQEEVLLKVQEAFKTGKKFIIIQAPTGFGKSMCNFTICDFYGTGYLSTPLKSLVDQMATDKYFGDRIVRLKGKSNYSCRIAYENVLGYQPEIDYEEPETRMSCEGAKCEKVKKFECSHKKEEDILDDDGNIVGTEVVGDCYHFVAWKRAKQSRIVTLPLMLLLIAKMLPKKEILVIDEGHNTENWLQTLISLTIPKMEGAPPKDIDEAITTLVMRIEEAKSIAEELDRKEELSDDEYKLKKKEEHIIERGQQIIEDYKQKREWVFVINQDEDDKRKKIYNMQFKPVFVDKYAGILWGHGDRVVISSATILDKNVFTNSLGIPINSCEFIDVRSCFPPENLQIINACVGKLSRNYIQDNLPKAVKMLEKILTVENDVRGLVHCHSYHIADYIEKNINPVFHARLLFHESKDRNFVLRQWLSDNEKNKVLIGVNMTEGLDLRDNIARFQAIMKAPYPDLSDSVVSRRINYPDGRAWYNVQAIRTIVQASGRANRHEEDFSRLYLIDSSILDLLYTNAGMMPLWFRESFYRMKRLTT